MLRLRYRFGVLRIGDFVRGSRLVLLIFLALVAGSLTSLKIPGGFSSGLRAAPPFSPPNPTQSSPIAITHNGQFVVNVNPDANTITVLRPTPHNLNKIKEIGVGREPVSIAAHPDNNRVYVANAIDGTVSKVNVPGQHVQKTIRVGASRWPWRCRRTAAACMWRIPHQTISWWWTRPATVSLRRSI